jgi:NAD-dependent deacetylase
MRRFLPTPVPLHRVGTKNAQTFGPSRAAGARYWTGLEELARTADRKVKDNTIRRALALISASERVVALTGAGMSTESGIPDYRSGIIDWTVYDPDELSYESFLADEKSRATYWRMSQDFYLLLRDAQPNTGHLALAELERLGKLKGIITQNVDRLHQRAGNTPENVVEIHGNEHGVTCLNCGATYSRDEVYRWVLHGTEVPYCVQCEGGFLKPDSIAFGQPMHFDKSRAALAMADRADCLIVCGTSLSVEPVASLVARTAARGARLIIVNFQPTDFDAIADCVLRGSTSTMLDRLVSDYRDLRDWVDT